MLINNNHNINIQSILELTIKWKENVFFVFIFVKIDKNKQNYK